MNGQQLKNSILQLAIQGKLVPQDPNDEPASVLLGKIRKEKEQLVKAGKLKKKDLVSTPIADEEKPFEIPEGWEWCRLGDIGPWGAGATPAKGKPEYYTNGTIPWLRTGELNNNIVYDVEIKVSTIALEQCSLRECEIGDVLIAMYGATIGKVAIAGIKLTTNQACCACTPLQIYNKYLLYYLMASKNAFIELGEGGAQPNISREKIVAFPFALPPLSEQHRIVSKIEELMPFVSEYDKAQSKLDELNDRLPSILKKSILQEAIMGKLVPQDPNDEPASVLLSKIRKEKEQLVKTGKLKKKDLVSMPIADEDKPFEIPESWEWCRLGDLVSNRAGLAYAKSDLDIKQNPLITVLRGGNISFGSWTYKDDDVKISKQFVNDELLLKKGTFITPAVTSLENMGKTALIENDCEDTVVGGFVLMLTPHLVDIPCSRFLLHLFNGSYFKESCKKITNKSGQAFYNISRAKMMDILIPLPPLSEQHRIVSKIEELFSELK